MNALESIVESSVDCRGGDNGVPLCPSPAVAPRNLKVVGGLHTAISSRLGRLIAAVIFLESIDITDKWGAKFDCVPALRSFPTTNASPLRVRPVATCQLPRGPLPTAEHRSRCMKIGHCGLQRAGGNFAA